MRQALHLSMALLLLTAGCATNEQTGELIGGVGGGTLGTLTGKYIGGQNGAIVGGAAGAAMGVVIGGAIGRNLDGPDRQRATKATEMVLDQRVPYSSRVTYYDPPPSAPPTPNQNQRTQRNVPARRSSASRAPSTQWTSDHSGNAGSASIVAVQPATSTSGECRTVHEIAYVGGKELSQDQRYCRDNSHQWQRA